MIGAPFRASPSARTRFARQRDVLRRPLALTPALSRKRAREFAARQPIALSCEAGEQPCQALSMSLHGWPDLRMALRMISSLRMHAVMATL